MAFETVTDHAKHGDEKIHLETLGTTVPALQADLIADRAAKEKALKRKIDIRMMPLMMLICMLPLSRSQNLFLANANALLTVIFLLDVLNYLDRNNIAIARLGTFEEDIGLHSNQYNTIISIFFVGYILTQIPTNMILDKVRPSLFLPLVMTAWAIVSACTGAVQSYGGMIALRFLLGFVEAPFFREHSHC